MIRLLATSAAFTIVTGPAEIHINLAKSLAHDLYLYHRTDSEIIDADTALLRMASKSLGVGSLVIMGRPDENRFADCVILQKRIPCMSKKFSTQRLTENE